MRWLAVVLLVWLFAGDWAGDARRDRIDPHVHVTAAPVAIYPGDPGRTDVGRLRFLGGVALHGAGAAFGGYSSLSVDGDRFTLLSDGGQLLQFRLRPNWTLWDEHAGELPTGPGTGWEKEDRDSESMALDPRSGRVWVGFENSNTLWRYAPGFARAEAWSHPTPMSGWPLNLGAESLVRLHDGRFVVIGENGRHRHTLHDLLVFPGDPTGPGRPYKLTYRSPVNYSPSDAAELPDGSLVILNRTFRLPYRFQVRVTTIPIADLRPGATVTGREIARFERPVLEDNYEGVAVTREGADTILWICSDDNQSRWQQSLLLKFKLSP